MPEDDLSPNSAALTAYERFMARDKRERGLSMTNAGADTAKITEKTADNHDKRRNPAADNTALHLCYGQIGISAVAAAVRYQGEAKNSAYAPAVLRSNEHGAAKT